MATASHLTKAFQWDLARQVERLDFLLRWLPRYAEWGYEELYLHLEDAVEYPSLPGVARSDAYTYRQFARLVAAATAAGIRVVPIVNLLGHTQYLIKTPELRDLNELRDPAGRPLARGQICPLHPRTPEVAGKLLRDVAPFCTAGKVHVGLDESFQLGRCPHCRAEIARVGLAGHFAAHVRRLHRLTGSLGLRLGLWADMLALLPAAILELPRDVIAYDWYYYPFTRHPRVELRNFAEVDLATPLRARGIEYWGCPMNGAFRHEPLPVFGERLANILSWWQRCRRVGAGGLLVTSWEANRLALELTMAVDAAAACLWLNPEITDPREMLARGFARVFGGRMAESAVPNAPAQHLRDHARRVKDNAPHLSQIHRWVRAALAGDACAFAGYHRWQINDRWDVCAGRAGPAPCEKELRKLGRICRSLLAGDPHGRHRPGRRPGLQAPDRQQAPPALAASLDFRRYLARRDVFVRRAAQAVLRMRRSSSARLRPASSPRRRSETGAALALLRAEAAAFAAAVRAGRAAARAMWTRSRDPRARGPNERMLARDAERLREWRHWLKQAARNPAIVWRATPVCGAWQLQFTVHHFAPAMQKIIVEQQQPDGSWTLLHESHLIEFRAFAARPRTRIRREFSVPVAEPLPAPPAADGRRLNAPLRSRATAEPGHLILQSDTGSRAVANRFPCLRLAVRGLGQVGVSNVELTNGVLTFRPHGWPTTRQKILGRPAPRQGFPANLAASPVGVPLAFPAQSAPSSDRASRRNADRRQLPAD